MVNIRKLFVCSKCSRGYDTEQKALDCELEHEKSDQEEQLKRKEYHNIKRFVQYYSVFDIKCKCCEQLFQVTVKFGSMGPDLPYEDKEYPCSICGHTACIYPEEDFDWG
jgi:hypothetical protein